MKDYRPSTFENNKAVQPLLSIIVQLANNLGDNASNNIVTMSSYECQWSVNDFWSCIFDTLTAMERSYLTIHLLAALISKNATDDNASAFYNWVPMDYLLFGCSLSKVHSIEVYYPVPMLSFTQSILSICPCIELHKYACNVWQIWFFCL